MEPGMRTLKRRESRLFEAMHTTALVLDSFGVGIMYALLGRVEGMVSPQHDTACECNQVPGYVIRIPVLVALRALASAKPVNELTMGLVPAPPKELPPGKARTTVKGHGATTLTAITPIFVTFYEQHRRWISATLGSDSSSWPPLFNFARVIRNAISHHQGRIGFDNPNASPVNWRGLTYSPRDIGRVVLPDDIDIGDLIVLLFDIGDELDRLGCPLNP